MISILTHGHYSAVVTSDPPPLKALVKEATGESVRRVGRLIQLALIGAGRCLGQRTLPSDTAVYLTSGRGDLEITLEVLAQMVEQGLPPKPLSFINTVSNSACFYLARQFGLRGSSQFVTRRYAPLESALELAWLDMHDGKIQTALLGSVDICTTPLEQHRKRLAVANEVIVGEGSHWFLLAAGTHSAALGNITDIACLPDRIALQDWLVRHITRDTVLAPGQYVDSVLADELQQLAAGNALYRLPGNMPWYDSHCGALLGQFLDERPAQRLLHIDTDFSGRYHTLCLELA